MVVDSPSLSLRFRVENRPQPLSLALSGFYFLQLYDVL